jgi:hypothetical protein
MSTSNGWDLTVQQFHGGQDWQYLASFVEDFSVTTNGLGTPQSGLDAVRNAACIHTMFNASVSSLLLTITQQRTRSQHYPRSPRFSGQMGMTSTKIVLFSVMVQASLLTS